MYSFAFDPQRRIFTIVGDGLWSMPTLAAFTTEVLARGAALRVRYGQFAVLNDVRKMGIQIPSVARGLEALTVQSAKITTAPVATVVTGTLAKLQAERVLHAANMKAFLTMEAAQEWLAGNWLSVAAA